MHNGSLNLVFEYCATDLERVINDKAMVLDAARIKRCMRGTNPHPDPNPEPRLGPRQARRNGRCPSMRPSCASPAS